VTHLSGILASRGAFFGDVSKGRILKSAEEFCERVENNALLQLVTTAPGEALSGGAQHKPDNEPSARCAPVPEWRRQLGGSVISNESNLFQPDVSFSTEAG
jgi:hypothetical protein